MNGAPVVRVAVAGADQAGKSTLVARLQFAAAGGRIAVADSPAEHGFASLVASAGGADAALLVVDAVTGVNDVTRRDLAITTLLGVRQLVVAVTKMDLVDFTQSVFEDVAAAVADALVRGRRNGLEPPAVQLVPVSAMTGENVSVPGQHTPWFAGPSLVDALLELPVGAAAFPGRFPVQVVIRPRTAEHPDYRGYAGRVEAGVFRPGDRVQVLPSGWFSRIEAIDTASGTLDEAGVGRSVTLRLADDLDVSRGEMLVADRDPRPDIRRELDLTLFWFADASLRQGSRYRLRQTTRDVLSVVDSVQSAFSTVDMGWSDQHAAVAAVQAEQIARVRLRLAESVVADRFADNRTTGVVLLIDEASGETVGAGLVG